MGIVIGMMGGGTGSTDGTGFPFLLFFPSFAFFFVGGELEWNGIDWGVLMEIEMGMIQIMKKREMADACCCCCCFLNLN